MAPFTWDTCPQCSAETRQRFADQTEDCITFICEVCFTALTYHDSGAIDRRPATDEERALVPPPVVWSDADRASWQDDMKEGQSELQAWFQAGCPGLTPELESALPENALEQIRRMLDLSGGH